VAAPPALTLGPEDADALRLADGAEAALSIDGLTARLPVRVAAGLPRGVAGIAVGVAGAPVLPLPAWARIAKP
jgi:hypothetical protein